MDTALKTNLDTIWMAEALRLAEQSRGIAPPNPWVGCILLREQAIVGRGRTEVPGSRHAERVALDEAGAAARGATAYVTLEPCSHYGRTPPCAEALIKAGVSRVVVGIEDPDPRVQGQGIALLERAGVAVTVGVHAEAIRSSLSPYIYQRQTGSSFFHLKLASSIDGRLAAEDGTSQWITGERARVDAHELRAQSQAILIGRGTAAIDQPRLTVRGASLALRHQPLRVILDSQGRLPCTGALFDTQQAPTLVCTTKAAREEKRAEWDDLGVEWMDLPEHDGKVDLQALRKELGRRGVLRTLVEGGSGLLTQLIRTGEFNCLSTYMGACMLGSNGLACIGDLGGTSITHALRLKLQQMQRLGDDVRLDYIIENSGEEPK